MAKTYNLLFALAFLVLLSVGFTSAAGLEISHVSAGSSGIHGQSVSGYLTLNYTNPSQNLTSVVLSGSNISFSQNNFAMTHGQLKNVTFTASIPLYTSVGNKPYSILSNGTNGSYITTDTDNFNIYVNQSKSLSVQSVVVNENQNATVRVTNTGNVDLNVELLVANNTVKYNVLTDSQLISPGDSESYSVSVDSSAISSSKIGLYSSTITAIASQGVNATGTITFEESYCKYGEQGSLIKVTDIEDRSQGDDFEWEPLKNVQVRVEVENNADSTKRVIVKLGLYDIEDNKFVELLEGKEIEESLRISDGDDATIDFDFTLPADLKDGGDYRLYVKAYESGEEADQCDGRSEKITIDSDKEVLVDEIEFQTPMTCGSTNSVSLLVYNVNRGDEELMRVNIYNKDLGIDEYSSQFEIDEGDSKRITIPFSVSSNAQEKIHRVVVSVEYDYRSSSETYRYDNDDAYFSLSVAGNCVDTSRPTVTARLNSSSNPKIGEDLVIEVSVKNNADAQKTFFLSAENFGSWAELSGISTTGLVINKAETKTSFITFNPTRSGEQTFNIKLVYDGKIFEQLVTVNVESEGNGFFSRAIENYGRTTVWLITAIAVLIALIILILIIKLIVSAAR